MQLAEIKPIATGHRLLGTYEWSDEKQMHISASYDRIAWFNRKLLVASLVTSVSSVKALRAAISSECGNAMHFSVPDRSPETGVRIDDQGYALHVHRLPFSTAHAVVINRRPGLLLNNSDAALWAELKAERFSTPLLRSWLPYIRGQLEANGCLVDAECVGCTCRVLRATTGDLDAIVESGLKLNLIRIEEE